MTTSHAVIRIADDHGEGMGRGVKQHDEGKRRKRSEHWGCQLNTYKVERGKNCEMMRIARTRYAVVAPKEKTYTLMGTPGGSTSDIKITNI